MSAPSPRPPSTAAARSSGAALRLALPMRARDPLEQGRSATPLELFFDLVVVVAVAVAAERLHHAIVEGDGASAVLSYALVFAAIWLAWVNFTWFASAYDTDDVVYRLGVFVIMTGALVLAAGLPAAFDERDFTLAVLGYVIMRAALVTQWARVAIDDEPRRPAAVRFAAGIAGCQLGWLSLLAVPELWPLAWAILLPAELLVPAWAERGAHTTFHPEHIRERYGLFMIIVLGESVLAATLAIRGATDGVGLTLELAGVLAGSLLVVFALWWIYFERPETHALDSVPAAIAWSYLHLPLFAAVAAVGAGLVLAIEEATGHAHVGAHLVGAAVGVPAVVFLLSLLALYAREPLSRAHRLLVPAAVALVAAAILTPAPVLATGLVLAGTAAAKVVLARREASAGAAAGAARPAGQPVG